MMLSGLHTVADIFCCTCGQIVGWKYVSSLYYSPHTAKEAFGLSICICSFVQFAKISLLFYITIISFRRQHMRRAKSTRRGSMFLKGETLLPVSWSTCITFFFSTVFIWIFYIHLLNQGEDSRWHWILDRLLYRLSV